MMTKSFHKQLISSIAGMACLGIGLNTLAAGPQDAKGLWMSGDQSAVIEFRECKDNPAHLCGVIVWDKDAGSKNDTCGVQISRLKRYEDAAWRDGWVLDPRSNKNYRAAIRVNGRVLALRAYIGTEVLGETEEMTRVETVPAGCKQHTH